MQAEKRIIFVLVCNHADRGERKREGGENVLGVKDWGEREAARAGGISLTTITLPVIRQASISQTTISSPTISLANDS